MAAAIKKSMWAGKSNILVCVRVRPLWEREGRSTVEVVDGQVVVCRDPGRAASDVLRKGRSRERQYAFDHAFGPEVPTARIYAQTTAFLLDGEPLQPRTPLAAPHGTRFARAPTRTVSTL